MRVLVVTESRVNLRLTNFGELASLANSLESRYEKHGPRLFYRNQKGIAPG